MIDAPQNAPEPRPLVVDADPQPPGDEPRLAGATRPGPDSTADGRVRLEHNKLEQEVKTLRFQRWLLGVGAAGGVLGALLTNLPHIKSLFTSESRTAIQIRSEDPFLERIAMVSVSSGSAAPVGFHLADSDTISVKPGPYKIKVLIGDSVIHERELVASDGEDSVIQVPGDVFRKIRIAVSGGPGPAHAGEALTFRVDSSGTGYAWVFTANGPECHLAFPHHPDGSAVADDENFIAARQSLTFPRPGPFGGVAAPSRRGAAKLYVLITSTKDIDLAKSIIANYCTLPVAKAGSSELRENWGMHVVDFDVR
jgi:hypothetical protein